MKQRRRVKEAKHHGWPVAAVQADELFRAETVALQDLISDGGVIFSQFFYVF